MSKRHERVVVGVFATIILVAHVLDPFSIDNDINQTIGFQLVRFHRLLYVGSFDHNFPGIMYFHAGIIAVLGNSDFAFRIVETLFHITGVIVFFGLLRRWFSFRASALSVLLFSVYYLYDPFGAIAGQRDSIAFIFVLFGCASFYRLVDNDSVRLLHRVSIILWIGVCIGTSIVFRPTCGLYAIVIVIAIWMKFKHSRVSFILLFFAGVLLVTIAAFAPYLWVDNALDRVFTCIIRFNTEVYAAPYHRLSFVSMLWKKHELFVDLILGLTVLYCAKKWNSPRLATLRSKMSRLDWVLLIGLYLGARIPIILMAKSIYYHFTPVVMLSMIPLGFALDIVLLKLNYRMATIATVTFMALLVAVALPWSYVIQFSEGVWSGVDDPYTYCHTRVMNNTLDEKTLSEYHLCEYLSQPWNQFGKIECQGVFTGVYWRTQREPASPFTTITSLAMESDAGKGPTDFQKRWIKEFIDSLYSVKPRFIILSTSHVVVPNFFPYTPFEQVHRFPGFDKLVTENYLVDTTIDTWVIYRKRSL